MKARQPGFVHRWYLGRSRKARAGGYRKSPDRTRTRLRQGVGRLVEHFAPHLSQLTKRFPDISIEIFADRDIANLAWREADVGLRTVRPTHGRLLIRQVGWWRLGLYAAKTYAAARVLQPGVTDLSSFDIIVWTKEHAHLRGGPWLAEHARNARVALAASSRRIHHAACKAGLGIAVLPCLLADRDPDLVCLLSSDRVIATKLWLVAHRDLAGTTPVRSVMDFIARVSPK